MNNVIIALKQGIRFKFNQDKYGESWRVLQIGGVPQETIYKCAKCS